MTDKASMEVPSPIDGVVESFAAKEGDTIQVGDTLLVVSASESKVESVKQQPKNSEKKESIQNPDSRLRGNDSKEEKPSAVLRSIPPV